MNKTFKWSVLLTIVIGIVWIFMPASLKMSPVLKLILFNYDISSPLSFSRFWDLIVLITFPVSVASLLKDDEDLNAGVIILSIMSVLPVLATFDNISDKLFQTVAFLFAVLIFGIITEGLPEFGRRKVIFKRLLASFLTIIVVNTLVFGIWNGLMVAGYFLLSFIVIAIVVIIAGFLWDVAKKTPNAFKSFFAWMNK